MNKMKYSQKFYRSLVNNDNVPMLIGGIGLVFIHPIVWIIESIIVGVWAILCSFGKPPNGD